MLSLAAERSMFTSISYQTQTQTEPGNLPSITRVIDAIQRKKTRDNAIVGLIIAGCICFTIWYLF